MRHTETGDPEGRDGGGTSEHPLVVVYRSVMMNYNEVYVRTEVEALSRYRGFYVGARRVSGRTGVELPEGRTITLRESYRTIDRLLDPVVTRVGYRLQRFTPSAPLGNVLARGMTVGRASEYAFLAHGVCPRLVRSLRRLRPAVVHAYTGVSGAHALPLARKLGVPLVVSFGGTDATATDEHLRQGIMRGDVFLNRRETMKREVRLIITISHYLRDRLVERGWPSDRIVVLHRGIDTCLFTPEGAPPLSARAPVVLYAGRLIEVKGTIYLLRAMREVQQRIPEAELVIAGGGVLRDALENEARQLGVRARFLGQVPADVIRACHAEAQVYCMPSVTASTGQREGLSNALLEAMASGLPVVASRSGGIPEAVGDAGFLVDERDVTALADRLAAVLSDASLRVRMSEASRRRVTTEFDLRRQAAKLEELYDLARRSHSTAPRERWR